jgi:predicted transport protein
MPLFENDGGKLRLLRPTNFALEKDIQRLLESNLASVFNCRFVATEFPTGAQHAGRIDTLALSEENNPVIIEYKKVESSELINQSLYYLHWIGDHRGDFQVAVDKALGAGVQVDWGDIRVICIAPGYKKYDIHAVQVMGANIELWQYRLFENNALYFEEVFRRAGGLLSDGAVVLEGRTSASGMTAGRKAAITQAQGVYTFDEHMDGASAPVREIVSVLRDCMLGLDDAVEESPKKFYIAYKVAQNFACMVVQKHGVTLYLKLNPADVGVPPNGRDVRGIGHWGTGDLELTIAGLPDAQAAKPLIAQAYQRIGG